jgi:hypothetical protein
MLKKPFKRTGKFDAIPKSMKRQCRSYNCACCGMPYWYTAKLMNGELVTMHNAKEALDHIFPRRFCSHLGLSPHRPWNILSICNVCHGRKKKSEERLWRGDTFGYIQALKQMNYPIDMVKYAAEQYGFKEVLSWL